MGQRRDRLDKRLAKQKVVREKNSRLKAKERVRRAARVAAKAARLAAKGQAPQSAGG
jgi:hypothetical protein